MTEDQSHMPQDCQLQVLYEGAGELTIIEKIRYWTFRLGSAGKRRLDRIRLRIAGKQETTSVGCDSAQVSESEGEKVSGRRPKFNDGEMVRVRPFEELSQHLDEHNRTEGLTFMPGMKELCGREFKVLKRVRAIFDERAWRMLRIKHTYILEGAICDSRGLYEREGCDRCCFYFWKDVWLEKSR
jgi:hypothetical protein